MEHKHFSTVSSQVRFQILILKFHVQNAVMEAEQGLMVSPYHAWIVFFPVVNYVSFSMLSHVHIF
jgi:hypothetical protein